MLLKEAPTCNQLINTYLLMFLKYAFTINWMSHICLDKVIKNNKLFPSTQFIRSLNAKLML